VGRVAVSTFVPQKFFKRLALVPPWPLTFPRCSAQS
jgi:hypothetical protein